MLKKLKIYVSEKSLFIINLKDFTLLSIKIKINTHNKK